MIKIYTAVFLILLLASPFAQEKQSENYEGVGGDGGGPKLSWSEIDKDPNLDPQFPLYQIKGRKISYRDLCLFGERIRTKEKWPMEKNTQEEMTLDYLLIDRNFEEEICQERDDKGVCIRSEIISQEIPLTETILILKRRENSHQITWEESFEKDFHLKDCKEETKETKETKKTKEEKALRPT